MTSTIVGILKFMTSTSVGILKFMTSTSVGILKFMTSTIVGIIKFMTSTIVGILKFMTCTIVGILKFMTSTNGIVCCSEYKKKLHWFVLCYEKRLQFSCSSELCTIFFYKLKARFLVCAVGLCRKYQKLLCWLICFVLYKYTVSPKIYKF